MADDILQGATAVVSNPSHHSDTPNENKVIGDAIDVVDSISSLPDAILHFIFSFIPTKFVIRTSVLSKRWRHVWSETPFLSIDLLRKDRNSIIETLTRHYSAPRIMSFRLCINDDVTTLTTPKSQVDRLIEFAMLSNTEKLSLEFRDSWFGNYGVSMEFCDSLFGKYNLPDFFYTNSSLKQLSIDSGTIVTLPTVSWTSLKILFLSFCKISDESFAKIMSGSPMLESLTLLHCHKLEHIDLSESLRLRRLDIEILGRMQIVAPHVHYLRLKLSQCQCVLVNVSSLTEADVDMTYCSDLGDFCDISTYKSDVLQMMIMKMLKMLQNVEKLTVGAVFLQILSHAELYDVPFPTLKVEVLTLETVIVASVILGIANLLQNSPRLKKLKLDKVDCNILPDRYLNSYLYRKRLDGLVFPTSEPELMRFMQFLLDNTRENDG